MQPLMWEMTESATRGSFLHCRDFFFFSSAHVTNKHKSNNMFIVQCSVRMLSNFMKSERQVSAEDLKDGHVSV